MNSPTSLKRQIAANSFFALNKLSSKLPLTDTHIILMYHRVLCPEEYPYTIQAGMYVRPETFEMQMQFLKKNSRVIPLETLIEEKISKQPGRKQELTVAITFDDGWADNATNAIPVLNKLQLPATIFLPTAFIGTGKLFWTDRLAINLNLLATNEERAKAIETRFNEISSDAPAKLDLLNYIQNSNDRIEKSPSSLLDQTIESLKTIPIEQRNTFLKSIDQICKEFCPDTLSLGPQFLNWDQVRELSQNPLITFGPHSHQHELMTNISPEQARDDTLQCLQTLKEQKVPQIPVFCYPNQSMNENTNTLLEELNITYSLGETPLKTPKHETFNRTGIHEDISHNNALFMFRVWTGR